MVYGGGALFLPGSTLLAPSSHLPGANMTIYVEGVCWEMINGGVMPNKYEIPGSLAGLDWREKCIISLWMWSSLGVIDITLQETDACTDESE